MSAPGYRVRTITDHDSKGEVMGWKWDSTVAATALAPGWKAQARGRIERLRKLIEGLRAK